MELTRWKEGRSAQWICAFVAVVGLGVLFQSVPAADWVGQIQHYFAALGWRGAFLFVAVYVLATMACIPAFVLTITGGAVYGLGPGAMLVALSTTTAAALAFLAGRHLAREKIERWTEESPKLGALDCAIGQGGWRVVALSRLSPLVPFGASNYLFGLTAVRFTPYLVTTVVAMFPVTFVYVYLGHVGALGLTSQHSRTPAEWALLLGGLVATAVLTVYLAILGRRNLHACMERAKRKAKKASPGRAHRRRTAIAFVVAIAVWTLVLCLQLA